MSSLAKYLNAFLREHLPRERKASAHTCETYAYSYQLLACFAAQRLKVRPSQIEIEDVDAPLVLGFLEYVERKRGNTARTRNVRLAAIKAFFRYLEHRHVAYLDQSRQIHAIPTKKIDEGLIDYLTRDELLAVLNAPDNRTRSGLRDRAMLHLAFAAGLRVSELISIRIDDLDKRKLDTIHVIGKGRRERVLPLWAETKDVLRSWLAVRPPSLNPELFLNANGKAMSRFGFAYVVSKHVKAAARQQPSLLKKRISPHALRHTCAMHTLQATRDVRKVSLWLGHATLQSTEVYLRADPTEKLEALMAMTPPGLKKGRFKAPDKLLSMLSDARSQSYAE
jgi:integrase/recombinase XerD